mmetsp:Transcript_71977/g.139087  ORF Transcript_71977/g.139087 Transcript_71977/m.139087 type:complete len:505 (-) Transcript_71977:121-1635(-)
MSSSPDFSSASSSCGTSSSEEDIEICNYQHFVRWAGAIFNVLCGLANGYDLSVVATMLNLIVADIALCGSRSLQDAREAVCPNKQAVMSMVAAGATCGRLFLTWIADRFGRRAALMVVDVIIISALAVQCLASNSVVFLIGRFLFGVGVGCAFVTSTVYLCEIAPPSQRGMFTALNELAVCVGFMMGLHVTTLLELDHVSWRVAVAISAVPVVVQLLFLPFLPESPRWLAIQGSSAGFEQSAHAFGLSQSEIDDLQLWVKQEAERSATEGSRGRKNMLDAQRKAWHSHARAFCVVLGFNIFNTGSGIYAMQAYAPDILRHLGITEPANWQPLVGWMKTAGALVTVMGADILCVGRRRLSMAGATGCCLCMLLLALSMIIPGAVPVVATALAYLVFMFAWNAGYGGLQFVVGLELLPSEVRSIWQGQILFLTGILEIAIYQCFLSALQADGVGTFLFFSFINLLGVVFAALYVPDVTGQSLEEVSKQSNRCQSQPWLRSMKDQFV